MIRLRLLPAFFLVFLLHINGRLIAQTYQIQEIEPFDVESSSLATAINNAGQIVGFIETEEGIIQAFLWDQGVLIPLDDLGGGYARALDINDLGQIAGESSTSSGLTHGCFWDVNLTPQDLGSALAPHSSKILSINNHGDTCGYSWQPGATLPQAFRRSSAGVTSVYDASDIAFTIAESINDHGRLTGVLRDTDGASGFQDKSGILPLPNLDGPGIRASFGHASGLNNLGESVGACELQFDSTEVTAPHQRAVLWRDGQIRDLSTDSTEPDDFAVSFSRATAINHFSQIVGTAAYRSDSEEYDIDPISLPPENFAEADGSTITLNRFFQRAFLWQNNSLQDLNKLIPPGSGWILLTANDINDLGQIVGFGIKNSTIRAFLLTPATAPTPQISLSSPLSPTLPLQGSSLLSTFSPNFSADHALIYCNGELTADLSGPIFETSLPLTHYGDNFIQIDLLDSQDHSLHSETFTLQARDRTFNEWATETGITADPLANPDNDAFPNLLEYALNTDPLSPTPNTIFSIHPTADGGLELLHKRRKQHQSLGLNYQLLETTDLHTWASHNPSVETTQDDGPTLPTETLRITLPTSADAQFFKLQISE